MKKYFIILIATILGCLQPLSAQQSDNYRWLSADAFASLLTCGPGDEFYESFGHSAIRICDTANRIDLVFNYGCFDFSQSHFYLNFAKGRMDYCVIAQSFADFMLEYQYFHRAVWEQRLRLSPDELNRLFTALSINARPENMYYKYDFFRDNCATRVREMVERSLDSRSLRRAPFPPEPQSYRDLFYRYTEGSLLWWRLGIDLLLGANCDQPMPTTAYTYIPMELLVQYDTCPLPAVMDVSSENDSEAEAAPPPETIAEPAVQLLVDSRNPRAKSLSPTLCFWLLFAVVLTLTLFARRRDWNLFWLDGILFGIVSLLSLLLLFLSLASDHWCCHTNFNLLWANPLFLWLLCRLRRPDRVVPLVVGILLLLFLAAWPLLPQHFNAAVLPIVLTLVLRLADRLLKSRKTKTT